jgi:hypothetical protein
MEARISTTKYILLPTNITTDRANYYKLLLTVLYSMQVCVNCEFIP